jgi:hypothetical protein
MVEFMGTNHPNRARSVVAALVLAGAGVLAPPALEAASVAVAPVTIGESLQAALRERYGTDEGPVLQQAADESLSRALKDAGAPLAGTEAVAGAGPLRIEVSIEEAVATHPTRRQLTDSPGLDYTRSIARGGARLHAVLRDADGKMIDQLDYDRYALSLQEASLSGGAWGDALLAFDGFAAQVIRSWRHYWTDGGH